MTESKLPAYLIGFRSRINGDVGGRTQMASIVCSAFILLATFFLLPWLYFLPKCVLAAMYVERAHVSMREMRRILTRSHFSIALVSSSSHYLRRHPMTSSTIGGEAFPASRGIFLISSPFFRMQAWVDMTLMSLTFFLSIIYNIEVGVISSLVISLLLVVHRSSKTRMTILVSFPIY